MIQLRHAAGEVFHFDLHQAQVFKHSHAFSENGASGERKTVLRQVARADALHGYYGAVVERLKTSKNLQQRRFAGAVSTDNTSAFLRVDKPIEIFEKDFGAEAFPGSGKLNHASLARFPT